MPTGYTGPVVEGEITSAKKFLKTVARAFGAFIHQRDSAVGPAREPEIELYYPQRLAEAEAELAVLTGWTPERIKIEHAEALKKNQADNDEAIERYRVTKDRLESMLAKVRAWEPNEQAAPVKKFAIEQLEQTLDFDCGKGPYLHGINPDAQGWYQEQLEAAKQEVEYMQTQADEELKRQVERKAYARAVLDSIDQIEEA